MGKVFRARHVELGSVHALKLLRLELCQDMEHARRFQREMQGLAAFSHPHVVPIHSAGHEQGRLYFVMDLLPGPSLDELLSRHELPTPKEAAQYTRAVASALTALHSEGAVHRDVKPANVLLDEQGQARLADFGLMRLVCDEASRLTHTGQLLGTPAFMAPEQARGEPVGPPCDVWGLGMLLYTLLRGRPAWSGGEAEIMAQARAGRVEPMPAAVPLELREICAKALEAEPGQRPAAAEVEVALDEYLSGRDSSRTSSLGPALGFGVLLLGGVGVLTSLFWPSSVTPRASPVAVVSSPQATSATPQPTASAPPLRIAEGTLERGALVMVTSGPTRDEERAQLAWVVSASDDLRPEFELLLGGDLRQGPVLAPLGGFRRDAFGVGATCLVSVYGKRHPCTIVRRVGPVALVRFDDLSSRWVQVSELTLVGRGADPGTDAEAKVGLALWRTTLYPAVVVADPSAADEMLRVAFLLDGGSWISQTRLYDLPARGDRIHFVDENKRQVTARVLSYPSPWVVEVELASGFNKVRLVEVGRINVTKEDRQE